jgi:hypothetical protein
MGGKVVMEAEKPVEVRVRDDDYERHESADEDDETIGYPRFWPLLRCL